MVRRLWGRRREPDPLGNGVWRRAHDRFRRAVDRYHAMLERLPAGAPRADLERVGAQLASAVDTVHAVCVRAQALAPSAGDDVPAGHHGVFLDVHRALTRSATLAAQAAEAVTLSIAEGGSGGAAAARASDQARAQVARAEALITSVHAEGEG